MNLAPLVQALVDALALFEFAGPDEIDPDTAVRGMEHVASSLQTLSEEDQRLLRAEFEKLAAECSDATHAAFIRALSDSIGLA